MHFAGGARLRPYRPIYQVFMHHTRGVLRELCILRAERGSAPTDHHRKYLCIIPEVCRKTIIARIQTPYIKTSQDHHRKYLCTIPEVCRKTIIARIQTPYIKASRKIRYNVKHAESAKYFYTAES